MRRVKQENSTGCGIACVAMVTGRSYQEVKGRMIQLKLISANRFRTDNDELKAALGVYGKKYRSKTIPKPDWNLFKEDSIVVINYNKKKDTWHWVVYEKNKKHVLDPRSKKPYRTITDKRMKIATRISHLTDAGRIARL